MLIIKKPIDIDDLVYDLCKVNGTYEYVGLFELGGDFETFFDNDKNPSIMKPKIRKWCDDNIDYYYQDNKVLIFFKNEEDATAFKLAWL